MPWGNAHCKNENNDIYTSANMFENIIYLKYHLLHKCMYNRCLGTDLKQTFCPA